MGPIGGIGGLVSGIDTNEILEALADFDRRAMAPLQGRKALLEGRSEALRTLNMRLLGAETELFYLRRASTFNARQASVVDQTILSANANSTAITGTYQVRVDQLAQAHQLNTGPQAEDATFTGSLTVQLGEGTEQSYDFEDKTLAEIAHTLNQDVAGGARAQVMTKDGEQRLVLTGRSVGAGQDLLLGGSLTEPGGVFDPAAMTELSASQGAQATLLWGGLESQVSSDNNSISGLIEGVTIEVRALGTTTVEVGTDTTPARERILAFVESLNEALTYYNANSSYGGGSTETGILFSEGDVRRGIQDLRSAFISAVTGEGAGDIKTIAGLGISIDDRSGLFSVDEAALNAALASDGGESVRRLFVEGRLGAGVKSRLDSLTQSSTGLLVTKEAGLRGTLADMGKRLISMESRVEQRQERYRAQFLAMEKMISQMQNQGNFLNSQIEGFMNMASARSSRRG